MNRVILECFYRDETLQAVSNYSFKGRISRPVTTYQRSEIWYSKSPITIAVAGHLMIVGHFHVTWFHVLSDSILKRKESKLASPRPFMLFITVFVGREFISFAIICMQVLACVLAPFLTSNSFVYFEEKKIDISKFSLLFSSKTQISHLFRTYTEGPRLTRKTGPGKTPRYAKSRCARLLLCSKCPSESPKPRETEESVLGEVTTV